MPRTTVPLPTPSATVPSRVFGDLDGSTFCVAVWITMSPTLTVYLSPSKVTVIPLNRSIANGLPADSTDSTVQVPWNFLSSFSTSALSSARALGTDASSPSVQNNVTTAIRIHVLLHLDPT